MARNFEHFKYTINELRKTIKLAGDVLPILRGRIEYAMERDDLTINEAQELVFYLGEDFMRRTESASMLASTGFDDD